MGKKKNKKHSKKSSQPNNNKLQQNTPLSQEHSTSHALPIIPIMSESIDITSETEQQNCANTTPYMTRVKQTIDTATGKIIEKSAKPSTENETVNSANVQQHAPVKTKSELPPNARRVGKTIDVHQLDETLNKSSSNSTEVANATPVAQTLLDDHSDFNYNTAPIQPTYAILAPNEKPNTRIVSKTIDISIDQATSSQIDTNSYSPLNGTRVKEAHPDYKSSEEQTFDTVDSNNAFINDIQNQPIEQSTKNAVEADGKTFYQKAKELYSRYSYTDTRQRIRYDNNGVLYIDNCPFQPINNTQSQSENSVHNDKIAGPFKSTNENLDFTPLNCYENFIPNIKLSETYKTAKEIVENFEKLFKPQTFGNNLVIWQNGVDKLLFIDDLKSFIKGQYFLSFINMEKPAPEVKMCCETIMFNMKTKYKTYSSKKLNHILCKNGHFDIRYDFSSDNPKILPNNYDIDDIRCRYRINANLHLPQTDPQFSTVDFLSLSPIKPLEFDRFICAISQGIPAIMYRIWEMIGSLLVPDNKCRAIFLLQGEPSSGKSILGKIISRLFDSEYVSNLNMSQLGNNTAAKALIDKQLNISLDLPNDVIPPSAISFLKQMTGGDLDSSSIDENSNNTFGHCKFLFATNHPLTIKGVDTAFAERIVCIPFFRSVPKQTQDPYLYEKLERELDYIATKAIFFYRYLVASNYVYAQQGYELFQANITTLSCVSDEDNVVVKDFAAACCVFGPHKIYTQDLYCEYLKYCKLNGIIPIEKPNAFSRVFKKCFDSCITSAKWRCDNNSALNGFRGVTITIFLGTEKYQSDDDYANYSMNQSPANAYDTSYDNNIDDITNTAK